MIAGGVWGNGKALGDEHAANFRFAESVWRLLDAQGQLRLMAAADAAKVVDDLK